jgi:metal-responsive CopG/Arc/MetJ family transcriptional regulator
LTFQVVSGSILFGNTILPYKKDGDMGRTAKLTVSLPKELISVADRIAKEKKISRSKVISDCLLNLAEKQKAAAMAEGYLNIVSEQEQTAAMAARLEHEVLPEWK